MNLLADLTKRLAAVEAKVNNVLQMAKVKSVDAGKNLLDIEARGIVLKDVPYLTWRAGNNGKSYWVPEIGESGLLLCPDGQAGNAVFLPSLNTKSNDAPANDPDKAVRIWKEGHSETHDGTQNKLTVILGEDAECTVELDKIQDRLDTSTRVTEADKIEDTVGTSKMSIEESQIKNVVGMNEKVLNAVGMAILGALFYNTGITNIQSPVGPCFFAPTPLPASAPSPPTGSSPNASGKVTKTPASNVNGVSVRSGSSLGVSVTIPTIPVTTPAGPGATTPTTVALSLSITSGTLNIQFPARNL